jgi:hypothetical protein
VRSGRGESGPDGSGASSASGVAGSLLSGQTSSKFAEFFIWPGSGTSATCLPPCQMPDSVCQMLCKSLAIASATAGGKGR